MIKFKSVDIDRGSVLHFLLLLVILIVAAHYSSSSQSWRLQFQHFVFDTFNKIHPRERGDSVVIVDIDEQALAKYGQWPWSRDVLSELTLRLTEMGAKSIVYDGVFAEKDRTSPKHFLDYLKEQENLDVQSVFSGQDIPDFDEQFARAIKDSGVVVTGFTYGEKARVNHKPLDKKRLQIRSDVNKIFLEDAPSFVAAAVNLPILSKAAAGNGSFMARPDFDGVLRRTGMVFSDGENLYPSLNLEALRVAVVGRKGYIKLANTPLEKKKEIDTNYRIVVGDYIIPVESDGKVYVYYRHFCNEQDVQRGKNNCLVTDYVSALYAMDADKKNEIASLIKDKVVLIGSSSEGLKDLRNTAINPHRPGVEVHANVVEQILQGKYLQRPGILQDYETSFIFFGGLFFILFAPFIGVIVSLLLCVTLIFAAVFGAFMAYVDYGLLIDPVYPSLSVLCIFIVSTILSYIRAESRRKHIRNAFGMYVARGVMRDLEKNPDKLKLGGESRDLTVMFTDIRKFTSISEGMSPEELIHLMNEFLTEMTDIVMIHEGTVDKYIGDAMMAFWNAPGDVEYHERKACEAALLMQGALDVINEKIIKNADEKEPILLKAGIGINTGSCAVGNMGSRQRFAYSALGDAVNLSSRLEGLTKAYKVGILIGEETYQSVLDFAVLDVDLVRVVGRSEPVKIYALLGNEEEAEKSEFQTLKKTHDEFMALYRKAKFKKALKLLDQDVFQSYNLSGLYAVYKGRIQDFIDNGTPENWNGVYFARGK